MLIMPIIKKHKQSGVTLIEVILIMLVISALLLGFLNINVQKMENLRRARTVLQMQQILNAALVYYIKNSKWPDRIDDLRGLYLPPAGVVFNNAWGLPFILRKTSNSSLIYLYTDTGSPANAQTIAGKLPQSFVSNASGIRHNPPDPDDCLAPPFSSICRFAVTSVNIPGQNLNNATAVNYANLYHNGACVPAPECPMDNNGVAMTPEIIVIPVAAAGVNNVPDPTQGAKCVLKGGYYVCDDLIASPMSSFTARAIGDASSVPPGAPIDLSKQKIPACDPTSPEMGTKGECIEDMKPTLDITQWKKITTGLYWRVCLSVATEKGLVQPRIMRAATGFTPAWGAASGAVIAITHCVVKNESRGSGFFVWGN